MNAANYTEFRAMHLLRSKANSDRLFESIEQMKTGKSFYQELIVAGIITTNS